MLGWLPVRAPLALSTSPRFAAHQVCAVIGLGLLALTTLGGCKKASRHSANVEIVQVQRFGRDLASGPSLMDVEMRYTDRPGDARTLVRADRAFSTCAKDIKAGDKVKVEVVSAYSDSRGQYRAEIKKIGDCAVQIDAKDEANYETVQTCVEKKATGSTVGVHCERKRTPALIEKCPWLRR